MAVFTQKTKKSAFIAAAAGQSRRYSLNILPGICRLAAGGCFVLASFMPQSALAAEGWGDQFDAGYAAGPAQLASDVPVLSKESLAATEVAISQYETIAAAGGWPQVPESAGTLRLGTVNPAVKALRRRLFVSGDLPAEAGLSPAFDSYVDAAVRRFQARHGLPANGVVDAVVYRAMNVSAESRLNQLRVNADRLSKLVAKTAKEKRFVMVNIPAAQIEAVQNDRVTQRYIAIVGKIDRQTPLLDSKIYEVILNPFWTVPTSIIRKDLIPLMQKDPDYLTRNNIHIYDGKGQEVTPESVDWHSDEAVRLRFRQDPGKINAMSSTKINFHNKYAVYMHDTPAQGLFNNLMRFDSSGCVRVQNVRDLNLWLLQDTPGWERVHMDEVIRSRVNTPIELKNPVPLHFVYVTAWATGDGAVQFRDDIYHMDGASELAFGDAPAAGGK